METRWHAFPDRSGVEKEAVARIARAAHEALSARDRFTLVLAGGETPRAVYEALRSLDTDWSRWRVYFGDERCLPVGDAGRNDTMAAETLLAHVSVAPEHVYAIAAELGATEGAREYRRTLAEVDDFDVVLLGLGEDGHTASLFPGNDWGEGPGAPDALAVVGAPKPPAERVTMSAARLGRARAVLFLVTGESKRGAVERWRSGVPLAAAAIRCAAGVDVLAEKSLLDPIGRMKELMRRIDEVPDAAPPYDPLEWDEQGLPR